MAHRVPIPRVVRRRFPYPVVDEEQFGLGGFRTSRQNLVLQAHAPVRDPQRPVDELAAKLGRISAYEALVRAGTRPPAQGEWTLLEMAAVGGDVNMVAYLLKKGDVRKDLETRDGNGYRPFLIAVQYNYLDVVRVLRQTERTYHGGDRFLAWK